MGRAALLKFISNGQFIGSKTKITIADSNISKSLGFFKNRYPALFKEYCINVLDMDVREEGFYEFLDNNLSDINYITVALDEDRFNIETAFEIKRLADRKAVDSSHELPAIAVHVRDNKELVRFPQLDENNRFENVTVFGLLGDIFTEDIVIHEQMDLMARAINTQYGTSNPQYAVAWNRLDSFARESNRAAAMHIKTKLKLSGLRMINSAELGDGCRVIRTRDELAEYLGDIRIENLARCEHLRWNAFHFASGWMGWKPEAASGAQKPKDAHNRRHACLVDWDRLKDVARVFGKTPPEYYQNLDVQQLLSIPDILKEAGFVICVDALN